MAKRATVTQARTAAPAAVTKKAVASGESAVRVRTKNTGFRMAFGDSVRSAVLNGTTAMWSAARTFFEAASNALRLDKAVDSGPNSANGEIERVRMRSRWTYANDPVWRQACRQIPNNVVHYGIKPVIKDKKLLKLWRRWVKESDVRGKLDFYGLQWQAALAVARDGESILRFRQRREGDTKSGILFQLQLLEADHLPLNKTETYGGNRITSGVEQDPIEKVVAYWLLDYHPKDMWQPSGDSVTPKRVPAEDVMHVFFPDRATSTRGYPMGAAGLNTSEAVRSYEIFELERKKGQAAYLGILKKPRLAGDEPEDDEDDEVGTPPPIVPNTNMIIPDDYEYSFEQPSSTDTNYGPYRRENLSAVAVSFGLAVEHITLNFQYLNDRQYRAVMLEVQRYLESLQYHMMVRQLCEPVWRRFVAEAILRKLWNPEVADGQTLAEAIEDACDIEWMCPARGYIHPVQEIDAFSKAVTNGFTSRKRVAASFGEDVEEIDADNESDMQRASDGKLAYPVYPKLAETIDTGQIRSSVEQYGVAVRAGAITPQADDEAAFRASFGLPPMGDKVKEHWDQTGGIKQPITLSNGSEVATGDASQELALAAAADAANAA